MRLRVDPLKSKGSLIPRGRVRYLDISAPSKAPSLARDEGVSGLNVVDQVGTTFTVAPTPIETPNMDMGDMEAFEAESTIDLITSMLPTSNIKAFLAAHAGSSVVTDPDQVSDN